MSRYGQLLIGVICCITVTVSAQSASAAQWTSARDAYLKGDFNGAAIIYERLLADSPNSYSTMYNLGNCYLQVGDMGQAILWYERALKVRPRDPEIRSNLSIAKARRTEPIVEIREFFAVRWIRAFSGLATVSFWAVASLLSFWISVFICVWSVRAGKWARLRWMALGFGIVFILTLWMGSQRFYDLRRSNVAIVVQTEIQVSIAPDDQSKLVAKISPGEKVIILDSLDNFFKVRLPNYEHGWIPMQGVEKI